MLLDYCATYSNTKSQYYASDMILHVDIDVAYLFMEGAKSQIAGHYFFSSLHPHSPLTPNLDDNSPLYILCILLHTIVASAAETATVGLFHNAQLVIFIRHFLIASGYPQTPTPIKTDISTSGAFVNKKIRQNIQKHET